MKKSAAAAALALPMAAAHGVDAPSNPDHVHVLRTGTLQVEAPPRLALRLFTGPGEELWVEGWKPTVLSGDGLAAGTVFVTDIHETTIWIVVDFDPESLHARYARVSPGSRAGTVDVKIESDGDDGSIARVTYELTGLSEAGNEQLREFDERAYAEMLKSWEQMIRDANVDYDSAFFADP